MEGKSGCCDGNLASKDRAQAGYTAPACGLKLERVDYGKWYVSAKRLILRQSERSLE